MAIDCFGRDINHVRITLTNHCVLEDRIFYPNPEWIQDDEIANWNKL